MWTADGLENAVMMSSALIMSTKMKTIMKIVAKQEHIEYESMFHQKKCNERHVEKHWKSKIRTVQSWYSETLILKKKYIICHPTSLHCFWWSKHLEPVPQLLSRNLLHSSGITYKHLLSFIPVGRKISTILLIMLRQLKQKHNDGFRKQNMISIKTFVIKIQGMYTLDRKCEEWHVSMVSVCLKI